MLCLPSMKTLENVHHTKIVCQLILFQNILLINNILMTDKSVAVSEDPVHFISVPQKLITSKLFH